MRNKAPIWLKFFAISVVMLFVAVLFITAFFAYQMVNKENAIIESNISNSTHYAELNVGNALRRYSEQIGSMELSEQIYNAKGNDNDTYRNTIRARISTIFSESSEVLAVFFQDSDGIYYSVGEVFWDINSQISMIHECKSKAEYTRSDGIWRHAKIGRGYNSIVLCKDIIYVDSEFFQHELGTMLIYIDADKLNADFFDANERNGIIVLDSYRKIVLAEDKALMGATYDKIFKIDGNNIIKDKKTYYAREKEIDINGWRIISYIDDTLTSRNVLYVGIRTVLFAIIGLLIVSSIAYILSRQVGRPIEDLIKYIKINQQGEIISLPEGSENENDIEQIRRVFESLSSDLKKNIEENYKMQLMLKDTKIKAYESQMNPHFLFNTLQMLQMMNVLGKKEDVATVTTSLGDLLRFNLDDRNEVTIGEEIENVLNYLRILELRFKGRFNYKIIMPDELMDCYTIKFMLQPLIENTVTHGFAHKKGVCEVVVMGQQINDELVVVVKDNGQGIDKEKLAELKKSLNDDKSKKRIGLANVHERIQLIYGEKYGVDIFSDYEKNTQVIIHIPVCQKPHEKGDVNVQDGNN